MIKIENTEVYGWESAVRGMRNPMNSWNKSDSDFTKFYSAYDIIGPNDLNLMKKLIEAGTDHSKFMRMITVTCDIIAPLYWWKEFDTYKVGTVRNSCSTMHMIHSKEFELDDFSHEHLITFKTRNMKKVDYANEIPLSVLETMETIISVLNYWREQYLETKDKIYWWQMIQLLPSSYNQRATVQLNYAVLHNIYHSRKNHKLDEWHKFCDWVESLPYSEGLICSE